MRLTIWLLLVSVMLGPLAAQDPAAGDAAAKPATPQEDPLRSGKAPPAGAIAVVDDRVVTIDAFVQAMYAKYVARSAGQSALNDLIHIFIVEKHANERGVTVTDDDVEAEYERLADLYEKSSGGNGSIEQELAKTGKTKADFMKRLKINLALQQVAQADFKDLDVKADPNLTKQWLKQKQVDAKIERRPGKLPRDAAARVYNGFITRTEFVRNLLPLLSDADIADSVRKMMQLQLAEKACDMRKITVTPEDVDRAFLLAKANFEANPKYKGIHFEDVVRQRTGMSPDAYKESGDFRLEVALLRLGEELVPDDKATAAYQDDIAFYGPIHTIQHILLRGSDEEKYKGVLRTMKQAEEQCASVKKRLDDGESFDDLIKMYSEDTNSKFKGGILGSFTPEMLKSYEKIQKELETMKVGDVRGPLRSKNGYHLIKLQKSDPPPALSATIVRDIRKRKAIEVFREMWNESERGVDVRRL